MFVCIGMYAYVCKNVCYVNMSERICEHIGVYEGDFTAIRYIQISAKASTESIKLVHKFTIHCNIFRV